MTLLYPLLNVLQALFLVLWSVFWITAAGLAMAVTLDGNTALMFARRFWASMHWRIGGAHHLGDERDRYRRSDARGGNCRHLAVGRCRRRAIPRHATSACRSHTRTTFIYTCRVRRDRPFGGRRCCLDFI